MGLSLMTISTRYYRIHSVEYMNMSNSIDPRESFRFLHRYIQPIVTFISGKPLSGARKVLDVSPFQAILFDAFKVIIGVCLALYAVSQSEIAWFTLVFAWIVIVNGARSLTSDAHYAGHGVITGNIKFDYLIGELLSSIVFSQNLRDYASQHNRKHHGKTGILTKEDPDVKMIYLLGFEFGRSVSFSYFRLACSLVSIRYHFLYTFYRLKSNLVDAKITRALLFILVQAGVFGIFHYFGLDQEYLYCWLVPLLPLYALSAAIQFPSEHNWLSPALDGECRKQHIKRVSYGRFFIISAPTYKGNTLVYLFNWGLWCIKMIPMLFGRFFVCVSILPSHDYHHRSTRCKNWPNEVYLRQQDQDLNNDYVDFYGLKEPIDNTFRTWSMLSESDYGKSNTLLSYLEQILLTRKMSRLWSFLR